jgi:hypothetical protein
MKAATALAKQLKSADFPTSHQRQLRAMHVAQSLAMHCNINGRGTLESVWEEYGPVLKKMINDINEFLPVDTKLVNELFDVMMNARLELLYGVRSPKLLQMVLGSDSQMERLSEDAQSVMRSYITHPEFASLQATVSELMRTELIGQEGEEQ